MSVHKKSRLSTSSTSSPDRLQSSKTTLIALLEKEACSQLVGLIRPFPAPLERLPQLPKGFKWRACNGEILSSSKNPLAYTVFGSHVPKIKAGQTLALEGDLGYRTLGLGESTKGGALNITGSFGPRRDYAYFRRDADYAGTTEGALMPDDQDYHSEFYFNTSTKGFAFGFDSSLVCYPGQSGSGEDSTPYQKKARQVVPQHIGVNFFVVIDVKGDLYE